MDHRSTIVTESVYRHQIRPVIRTGAVATVRNVDTQVDTQQQQSPAPWTGAGL